MALWDSAISTNSYKCPGCASNMTFEPKFGKIFCRNCGSFYNPSTLELTDSLTNYDIGDADENEEDKQEIVCNSCGAAVITDRYTSATFCAFCGSNVLVNRRLSHQFRPDYVIPFKVTREEAQEKFLEWSKKTKRFAPNKYLSKGTVEKITGLYVPFWLVDGTCHANIYGSGKITEGEYSTVYDIRRAADFKMRRIPFDGSKAIDNLMMKAIEPFDYSEMIPFNGAYLSGFFARRYDETPVDMAERIQIRFEQYMKEECKRMVTGYDSFNLSTNESTVENMSNKYALFPVWFMRFKYNDKNYDFCVNGQTGEVAGQAPQSMIKIMIRRALVYLISALIILVELSIAIAPNLFLSDNYSIFKSSFALQLISGTLFFLNIALVLTYKLAPKFLSRFINFYKEKLLKFGDTSDYLDPMPDPSQYIDDRDGITLIAKEDKLALVNNRTKYAEDERRVRKGRYGSF